LEELNEELEILNVEARGLEETIAENVMMLLEGENVIRRRTWNDWTKVEFSDLFASPPRNGIYKSKEFQGYGTPLVKMNELFRLSFISLENCYFEKISLTESEKQKLLLADQDLLFSRTSVVADGVGKCSLISLPKSKELIFDSNIIRIRLNQKEAIPLFYFYYFLSPQGRNKIKAIASGAAVTTVTGKNLSSLEVPHPSIPIQRKIAAILSAYDDLIENNTRRIEILEEMARSIYREWFVNFRSETEKVENRTLNDICEFIVDCEHKTAPTQATGYPSIRTPNIGRGRLLLDKVNRVSEETYKAWTKRAIPQEGDLILAREAPVEMLQLYPKI
jgi:restriction endonuclease S subunit